MSGMPGPLSTATMSSAVSRGDRRPMGDCWRKSAPLRACLLMLLASSLASTAAWSGSAPDIPQTCASPRARSAAVWTALW
ncbi:hypothetical protein SALBM135S_05328 [Streptomyces alboniger]